MKVKFKQLREENKIGGMLGLKIRKAIEIAKKSSGNYSGAAREIEKYEKVYLTIQKLRMH